MWIHADLPEERCSARRRWVFSVLQSQLPHLHALPRLHPKPGRQNTNARPPFQQFLSWPCIGHTFADQFPTGSRGLGSGNPSFHSSPGTLRVFPYQCPVIGATQPCCVLLRAPAHTSGPCGNPAALSGCCCWSPASSQQAGCLRQGRGGRECNPRGRARPSLCWARTPTPVTMVSRKGQSWWCRGQCACRAAGHSTAAASLLPVCNIWALPDPEEPTTSSTNAAKGVKLILSGVFGGEHKAGCTPLWGGGVHASAPHISTSAMEPIARPLAAAMQTFSGVPAKIGGLGAGVLAGLSGTVRVWQGGQEPPRALLCACVRWRASCRASPVVQ